MRWALAATWICGALASGGAAAEPAPPPDAGAETAQTAKQADEAAAAEGNAVLATPGSAERTAIAASTPPLATSQYFFLHDDNFFAFAVNDGWPARTKFQFSLRFDVVSLRETHNFGFNLAFTQKSFWDMLDFDRSSPFVESNYRPEAFFSYRPRRDQRFRELQLGVQHESNGMGLPTPANPADDSRSWSYVFVDAHYGFTRSNAAGPWFWVTPGLRLWVPLETSSPALRDTLGYFMLYADIDLRIPSLPVASRLSARVKLRRHNIEANLYYPLLALTTGGAVRIWLFGQVFHGKGERLITFDEDVTHLYAGIAFR